MGQPNSKPPFRMRPVISVPLLETFPNPFSETEPAKPVTGRSNTSRARMVTGNALSRFCGDPIVSQRKWCNGAAAMLNGLLTPWCPRPSLAVNCRPLSASLTVTNPFQTPLLKPLIERGSDDNAPLV